MKAHPPASSKMARYHSNPEFRERVLARSKKWAAENPERRKAIQLAYNHRRRHQPFIWAKHMVSALRARAVRNGLPFDLSETDIFAALPDDGRCPVLGIELTLGGGRISRNTASIDRIRPELGYVQGNIAVISWWANVIKQDVTDPQILRRVADYIERTVTAQEVN